MLDITVTQLEKAFIYASSLVIDNEVAINEINVFPVSDNDTGSNLSSAFNAIVSDYVKSSDISTMMNQIADIAFENARGNSGIILSIWLNGLAKISEPSEKITIKTFYNMLYDSSCYLTNEMIDLAPGSMVTYLAALSQHLLGQDKLQTSYTTFDTLLLNTTNENPMLKSHGVVDAGAMAMNIFIKSLFDCLLGKVELTDELLNRHDIAGELNHSLHEVLDCPSVRYCAEAKISAKEECFDNIKSLMNELGESNHFLYRNNMIKFHTHTNQPMTLFERLTAYGDIHNPKVDDMLRQYQSSQSKSRFAIVTDSSADVPYDIIEKYNIHVIPLNIFFDNQQGLDGLTVSSSFLYQRLDTFSKYPTTALPNLNNARKLIEFLAAHHQHVFIITLSSKMSGTYVQLSNLLKSYHNVSLIDSLKNSGAHGWLVQYAAELMASSTEVNAKAITQQLLRYRKNLSMYVLVPSTKAMERSGRLSKAKSKIISFLNIKPVISVNDDGEGYICMKRFSTRSAEKALIKLCKQMKRDNQLERYSVMHVNNEHNAIKFGETLSRIIGFPPAYIKPVSSVIGIHAGLGAIGVAIDKGDSQ